MKDKCQKISGYSEISGESRGNSNFKISWNQITNLLKFVKTAVCWNCVIPVKLMLSHSYCQLVYKSLKKSNQRRAVYK